MTEKSLAVDYFSCVAQDGARDKPLEFNGSREALVPLVFAGAADELGNGVAVSPMIDTDFFDD